MPEGRVDDGMIEIGDPTEDSPGAETPPQVVIQYHERGGVPWMLIPPLLVLSAVVAVLLYQKLAPRPSPTPPQVVATANEGAGSDSGGLVPPIPPPSAAIELEPPAKPTDASPPPVATTPPDAVDEPARPKERDPAPSHRIEGLGFDPKALEADRRPEAQADPALAPAARDDVPADADKPREVDPELLPPDPRQARVRQQQRRVDALKKVDDERARFHADLKAICALKFRRDTGDKINDLQKRYETRVEPAAQARAGELLGKNGKFAGADRRTRIELLRALGFPEPVILGNLFNQYGMKSLGERDGPGSPEEAMYQSALFLIRNPPARGIPSRPASNPATGLGPAR